MTDPVDHWDLIWQIGLISALLYFVIVEGVAIATHRMDRTLSERLRAWLGIYPVRPWRKLGGLLFAVGLGGGAVVLIWHILVP